MQNLSKQKRQQTSLPWLPDQWHKMHIAASLRRLRFWSQPALPVNLGFPVALGIQKASKTPTELKDVESISWWLLGQITPSRGMASGCCRRVAK